jgi:hypothetical protein
MASEYAASDEERSGQSSAGGGAGLAEGSGMTRRAAMLALAALFGACSHPHERVVHIIAETAPGMKVGSRVQYRGVDVGVVREVYFTNGGVRIDALLERPDVALRAQDTVRIVPTGLFGEQIVQIAPGPETAPVIARNTSLAAKPESTVTMSAELYQALSRTMDRVVERDSAGRLRLRTDSAVVTPRTPQPKPEP